MSKIRMLRSLVGLSKLGRHMSKKGVKPNKLPKEAKHMKSYIERHTPGRERMRTATQSMYDKLSHGDKTFEQVGADYVQARAKAYYRSGMAPTHSYIEGSSVVRGRPVSQANVTGSMIKDMRKASKHVDNLWAWPSFDDGPNIRRWMSSSLPRTKSRMENVIKDSFKRKKGK